MVLFIQKMESTTKVTSEQLAQKQKVVEERKQKVNHIIACWRVNP